MNINDSFLLKHLDNGNALCFGLVESEGTSSKQSLFKSKADCLGFEF